MYVVRNLRVVSSWNEVVVRKGTYLYIQLTLYWTTTVLENVFNASAMYVLYTSVMYTIITLLQLLRHTVEYLQN